VKELRNLIGVSFKELEELLWTAMRREFSKVLASILERLDDWLKEHLDPKRYEVKGRETRGLVSLLGDDLTFKRRRYLDKQTGAYCYGLDEALELPDRERVSPGMKSIILTQAVTTNSYRKAAESVDGFVPSVTRRYARWSRASEQVLRLPLQRPLKRLKGNGKSGFCLPRWTVYTSRCNAGQNAM
jgi:Uncharacterised protein family (UPF0236).